MTDTFLTPGSLRPPVDARPTAVGNRANDKNSSRLREACSEFEALFINLLLKELRATVGKSGLMDGGQAEEVEQEGHGHHDAGEEARRGLGCS